MGRIIPSSHSRCFDDLSLGDVFDTVPLIALTDGLAAAFS
jgi:hypothetical protein